MTRAVPGDRRLATHNVIAHCLAKPGAWQDEPWEGDVVAKVADKIFAFFGAGDSVSVKCGANREDADEWLVRYPDDVQAMAYIGRYGWNTIRLEAAVPDAEILEAVDGSYDGVVARLPQRSRPKYGGHSGRRMRDCAARGGEYSFAATSSSRSCGTRTRSVRPVSPVLPAGRKRPPVGRSPSSRR